MHLRPHALFLVLLLAAPAAAAPDAELWPRWQAHSAGSGATVDHRAWAEFLHRYVRPVDGVNLVAYGTVSADDRRALDRYLGRLAASTVAALDRPEQMAFWINLYNALTVRVVLDHYPTDSIRDIDISPGLFSDGPWGRKLIAIDGEELSLDDIEHRILRPIWRDPRIHYAVNCASVGCPNLAAEPYAGDRIEAQLDAAARAYVNHPRGVKVSDGSLTVSSIYDWYSGDFGGDDRAVIEHLIRFAGPDLQQQLAPITRIAGDDYDWSLNDLGP